MAEVPNPTATAGATARGAKGAAGLLRKQKPIVIGGLILGVLVVAYIIRKRNAAAASDVMANGDTDTSAVTDPTTGYSSYYPDASQGAYSGGYYPADPSGVDMSPNTTTDDVLSILGVLFPSGIAATGGGAPSTTVDAHSAVPQQAAYDGGGAAAATAVAPPAPPVVNAAPAALPHAVASGPQPNLGPNIFYNDSRRLRYIIQRVAGKGNYKYYESSLNKGDWGKGGVIPQ